MLQTNVTTVFDMRENKIRMVVMKIGIEYIAANALVELYENSKQNYVSIEDLRNYGITVKEILKDNNIEAILLMSDYYLIQFVHNYSDMFEVFNEKIYKKDNVTCDDIRERIIAYMKMDLLMAMVDKKSLEVLGINQ